MSSSPTISDYRFFSKTSCQLTLPHTFWRPWKNHKTCITKVIRVLAYYSHQFPIIKSKWCEKINFEFRSYPKLGYLTRDTLLTLISHSNTFSSHSTLAHSLLRRQIETFRSLDSTMKRMSISKGWNAYVFWTKSFATLINCCWSRNLVALRKLRLLGVRTCE